MAKQNNMKTRTGNLFPILETFFLPFNFHHYLYITLTLYFMKLFIDIDLLDPQSASQPTQQVT